MKKRFPFITLGLCLITWAITIFLFFFLHPSGEKSNVFYFNLGYSLVLEFLFFLYIGFLRAAGPGLTRAAFAPVYGTINLSYIITGALLMIVWNLFLTELVPFRWFIAVLIIITLIFLVTGGLVGKVQQNHHESMETADGSEDLKNAFIQAQMRLDGVLKQKGFQPTYQTALESLVNPVKCLPVNAFQNNRVNRELNEVLRSVHEWTDQMASGGYSREEGENQLASFLSDTRVRIDFIIKSARR